LLVGLALTAAYVLLVRAGLLPALACPFRSLTGVPCPLCGTTTSLTRLLAGDAAGAVTANPLVALLGLLLAVAALGTLLRLLLGRGVRLRLSARERQSAWLTLPLALLANWLYLLLR